MSKKIHFIPNETDALKEWHQHSGEEFFKQLGVNKADYILDFGCGAGTYVFPAARIVGSEGRVYALDYEQIVMDEIETSSKKYDVEEIVIPVKTKGEFRFAFENETMNLILLIDVIGIIIGSEGGLKSLETLVRELHRILKLGGRICAAFKHVRMWRFSKERVLKIFFKYFDLDEEKELRHIHWDFFENDIITLFRKKQL